MCQPVAKALRPYIGPVLFDVVQTRCAVRLAVNSPPASWNIGEGRPQAVLLLVVDQDQKGALVIVERIGAHRFSRPFSRTREPYRTLTGSARRFDRRNRARTTRYVRLEHLINCGGYSRGLGNLSSCAQTVTIPYRVGKESISNTRYGDDLRGLLVTSACAPRGVARVRYPPHDHRATPSSFGRPPACRHLACSSGPKSA